MRKIEIKNEVIKSSKIKRNVKIVLMSDIHYSKIINQDDLKRLIISLKKINPNYIFIAGDLIDSADIFLDKKIFNSFINFLKHLSEISKVLICIGNHDIYKKNYKTREFSNPEEYIKAMNIINNVKVLNNDKFEDENLYVYGQTRSFENYIDEYHKNLTPPKLYSKKYSILLTHSPINIKEHSFDLTLTGHMHNGLFPSFLEKIFPSNIGLVGPGKTFFPKIARGTIINKEKYLIISGGVTKTSPSQTKTLLWLNNLFPISINEIEIIKKD